MIEPLNEFNFNLKNADIDDDHRLKLTIIHDLCA